MAEMSKELALVEAIRGAGIYLAAAESQGSTPKLSISTVRCLTEAGENWLNFTKAHPLTATAASLMDDAEFHEKRYRWLEQKVVDQEREQEQLAELLSGLRNVITEKELELKQLREECPVSAGAAFAHAKKRKNSV